MRTLIEASAAYNQGAGIGRYARNIIRRLIRQGATDQWTLVKAPDAQGANRHFVSSSQPNVKFVTLPFNRRNADRLWFRLNAPVNIRLFAGKADVLYSPDFTAPPMRGVPRIITVHDLAFMTHPDQTTDALRGFLERVVPRQVQLADKVAVVSYATRDDLMRHMDVPEERIVVVRNGVDSRFESARPLDMASRYRLGLPERYLLMVGTIEPRKNHVNALKALQTSGVGKRVPLVIAGRPGWGYEEAMDLARSFADQRLVILLDYIRDEDLPGLYAGATGLLYPSWTEGFGLPVAEGLAAGIQVITGTAPALREVGGDEAWYVDPADVDGMAEQIRRVVETESNDADRVRRQEWARQFSWDSSTSIVQKNLKMLIR